MNNLRHLNRAKAGFTPNPTFNHLPVFAYGSIFYSVVQHHHTGYFERVKQNGGSEGIRCRRSLLIDL